VDQLGVWTLLVVMLVLTVPVGIAMLEVLNASDTNQQACPIILSSLEALVSSRVLRGAVGCELWAVNCLFQRKSSLKATPPPLNRAPRSV